jgi:FlaA1/EpsC-like NDP-sugar epimerase
LPSRFDEAILHLLGQSRYNRVMNLTTIFRPSKMKRFLFFLLGDGTLLSFALILAILVRFEFVFERDHWRMSETWLPLFVSIKIVFLYFFGLYNFTWVFVGIKELLAVLNACMFSTGLLYLINMTAPQLGLLPLLPRSVLLIDLLLSILFIGNFRVAKRIYLEALRIPSTGKRVLIVGAGPTGERLVREFLRSPETSYLPVALVDDDPTKIGTSLHGVKVAGKIADIPRIVEQTDAQVGIIAITTAKHVMIKSYFDLLNDAGIKEIKVVPHINQLPSRSLSVKDIHDIRIEDLLYRETVDTDQESIRNFLQSRSILVTGAAGSIGSEIVRQVLQYHPSKLIVFDIDETDIFNLMMVVKPLARLSTEVIPYIGDVRHERTLDKLFDHHKPQIVFHAAAYKHVPMMELFPDEALETNFLGTYQLASAALKYSVERFVNISTDKAVNPSSIMGATKRLAEMVCTTFNRLNGTRFVSVRFGNVLGSRGSVVPIFLDQIKKGGPVTVTHPEVERYFMTIPEAVSLVFQAAAMGKGGEVFVLDMGKPVQVLKIAEDLIKLNGMDPYTDIKIEFVGLRPGEKMFEELLTAEEGTNSTAHEKIFIARNISKFDLKSLEQVIESLQAVLGQSNGNIRNFLRHYVPFYDRSGNATT